MILKRIIIVCGLLAIALSGCVIQKTAKGSKTGLLGVEDFKTERQRQAQGNFESDLNKKMGPQKR